MEHTTLHVPGHLPEIHDEAGPTPLWIPALGLALIVIATLWLFVPLEPRNLQRSLSPESAETP